jgi:hypothetical protein
MLSTLSRHVAPALRLSDAERERAVGSLKTHYAQGRLNVTELEERVEDVYRSDTRVAFATFLRGLTWLTVGGLIVRRARRVERAVLRMHLLTYLTLNASLLGIWALTGQGEFWPAWLLLPSTALLGWHMFLSRAFTRALARRGW